MRRIVINSSPWELRVAVLQDGLLDDFCIDWPERPSLLGNIYLGRVKRVMGGLDAAFIEFGAGQTGFLPSVSGRPQGEQGGVKWGAGQPLLVQVSKDAQNGKLAELTQDISLRGAALVFLPLGSGLHLSRQLSSQQREQLSQQASTIGQGAGGGIILRRSAARLGIQQCEVELRRLKERWQYVRERARSAATGSLLLAGAGALEGLLQDYAGREVDGIEVDADGLAEQLRTWLLDWPAHRRPRLSVHAGPVPIFEHFGVEQQLGHALDRTVDLKGGGSLIFDRTEALTVIDVNSGARSGESTCPGDLALAVNQEAARVLARQLRVRNVGGIVLVDFVSMPRAAQRRQLLAALQQAVQEDRQPIRLGRFSALGLFELTRQRSRPPLAHYFLDELQTHLTPETRSSLAARGRAVLRTVHGRLALEQTGPLCLCVDPLVAQWLLNGPGAAYWQRLQNDCKRELILRSGPEDADQSPSFCAT